MWLPRFLSLPNSVPHCSHFSAHSSTILSVLSSKTFCTERVNCACYLLGAQYVLISCLLPPNPCQAPTHLGNSAKCWWKCSKRKREILTKYWTNTCYIPGLCQALAVFCYSDKNAAKKRNTDRITGQILVTSNPCQAPTHLRNSVKALIKRDQIIEI